MNTAKMKSQILLCALVIAFAWALSYLGPALDDRGGEFLAAQEIEASIKDADRQERFAKAAQAMCGANAAWQDLGGGAVQCFTHRGFKTIKGEL